MAITNQARGGVATNTTSSATSLAISPVTKPIAGDFIFVTVSTLAANATTAVADDIGNKYYLIANQAGASGRISCWFCPSSSGTVTTITATHAASRASGSVSTYTGVLGVGQWKATTNAANNNTITLTNALGSGNLMLAGMGDAVGTQTWTAVTGTLRNPEPGGGTTTPGCTNIESSTTTCAASLSSSVSGEAIAIELLSTPLLMARDTNEIYSDLTPPFMWSMGTLEFLAETEQFDWGFNQPPPAVTNAFDDSKVQIPQQMGYYCLDDTEKFNWGFNIATLGGGGTNMMGFRGNWSLKAGMGSEVDNWSFNSVEVVTAISAFNEIDQQIAQQLSVVAKIEDEFAQFGWQPPILRTYQEDAIYQDKPQLQSYFVSDSTSELEAITEDFVHEMVSLDQMQSVSQMLGMVHVELDQFGFQTQVVTVTTAFDEDQNLTQMQSMYPEVEQIVFQSPGGQEAAAHGEGESVFQMSLVIQDDDQFGFQTQVVAAVTAFADEQPSIQQTTMIPEIEREQEDWGLNLPTLGGTGTGMMGFRGFWSLKAGMGSELDSWGFNQPIVTAITAFDDDQQMFKMSSVVDMAEGTDVEIDQPFSTEADQLFLYQSSNIRESDSDQITTEGFTTDRVPEDFEQFVYTNQLAIYWTDEDSSQSTFFALEQYGEVQEFGPRQQLSYLVPELDSDFDTSQSTFFASERFGDADEQLVVTVQLARQWMDDEQFGFNVPELVGELLLDEELQLANAPYPVVQWADDGQFGKQSPFFPAFPSDDSPEQFPNFVYGKDDVDGSNFTVYLVDDASEDRAVAWAGLQWTDDDKTDSTFFSQEQFGEVQEIPIVQQLTIVPEIEREQEDWGWMPPMTPVSFDQDDLIFSFWTFTRADNESEQFGFNFVTPTIVNPFDQDELPVSSRMPFQDVEDVMIDPVTADSVEISFYLSQVITQWADDDMSQSSFFALEQYADIELQNPLMVNVIGYDGDFVYWPPMVQDEGLNPVERFVIWISEEEFGFNTPELVGELLLDEELQIGNQRYSVVQWTDDDTAQSSFFSQEQYADQDEQPWPQFLFVKAGVEEEQSNLVLQSLIPDEQNPIVAYIYEDNESEQFGFNQVVVVVTAPFDQDFQVANAPSPNIQQVEDEQFGQNPPFLVPSWNDDEFEQMASGWAQRDDVETFGYETVFVLGDETAALIIQRIVTPADDDFGFNVPELIGELLLDEELQMGNQSFSVIQQVEDEQFGQNAPFLTSFPSDDSLDQFPNFTYGKDSVDEFTSQSTFFSQEQFSDNDLQTPLLVSVIGHEDDFVYWPPMVQDEGLTITTQQLVVLQDEDFGFNTPELIGELLLDEEIELANVPYSVIQQVEDEQMYPSTPFLTSFPSDDSLEQLANPPYPVTYQLENDQMYPTAPFLTSFPSDDSLDQLMNKAYPIVADDDLVFPASKILPNMFYDTDFNPTMQQSYYFYSEDLEKYNWGFKPPVTKTYQEDALYQDQPQLRSYFVPEIEDEMFSWGFDRSRYYALGDEAPYFTPAQLRSFYVPELGDEPWGLNQRFGFDQDDLQFNMARMIDADTYDINSYPVFVQGDEVSLEYPNWAMDDVEQFSFNVPEVLGELVLDEELQLANSPWPITQQTENELFGLNQVFGFDEDGSLVIAKGNYADDEMFGFDTQFAVSQEEVSNSQDMVKPYYDDWGISIGFSDSDIQGPNTSVILCISQDEDVFGFQQQFVMAFDDGQEQIPTLRQTMDDVEQFGFQTSVVVVNQPWDTEFNPTVPMMVWTDIVIDFGLDTPFVQGDTLESLVTVSGRQETDGDIASSTFFASEQYGDAPETSIPQQISYYFKAVDAESDYVQSTFFTTEEFADLDEQSFASKLPVFGHEDDFLYWPPSTYDETVDVEGVTFLVQQVDEDFVMNTLVLQPWAEDQIIPIPQQLLMYLKDLGTDSDYQLSKLTRIPILLVYAVGIKAALTLMSLAITMSKLSMENMQAQSELSVDSFEVVSPSLEVEDVEVTTTLTVDFFEVIGWGRSG